MLGVFGSRRLAPATRTEALALQAGYHFGAGTLDHAFTLAAGIGIGSGNCGEHEIGGHLAYSALARFDWFVTGGEIAVGGFTEHRCHRPADGLHVSERSVDRVSLAWLAGVDVGRLVFGLSLRLGLGEWERSTSHGGMYPNDAGGFAFTIDVGPWIQLRL